MVSLVVPGETEQPLVLVEVECMMEGTDTSVVDERVNAIIESYEAERGFVIDSERIQLYSSVQNIYDLVSILAAAREEVSSDELMDMSARLDGQEDRLVFMRAVEKASENIDNFPLQALTPESLERMQLLVYWVNARREALNDALARDAALARQRARAPAPPRRRVAKFHTEEWAADARYVRDHQRDILSLPGSLPMSVLLNALSFEMRHWYVGRDPAACAAWLRQCIHGGECPTTDEEAGDTAGDGCDRQKVIRTTEKIANQLKSVALKNEFYKRATQMANAYWVSPESRTRVRRPMGKYLFDLVQAINAHPEGQTW